MRLEKIDLGQRTALALQALDLLLDVDLVVVADEAKFLDLGLQFGDRLLEFEKIKIHCSVSAAPETR